jgi:hypothetical protein
VDLTPAPSTRPQPLGPPGDVVRGGWPARPGAAVPAESLDPLTGDVPAPGAAAPGASRRPGRAGARTWWAALAATAAVLGGGALHADVAGPAPAPASQVVPAAPVPGGLAGGLDVLERRGAARAAAGCPVS